LKVVLNQIQIDSLSEALILNHHDLKATNGFDTPNEMTCQPFDQVPVEDNAVIAELSAASLTRLVISVAQPAI